MNIAKTKASALAVARMRKAKDARTAILGRAAPSAVRGALFLASPAHWLLGFVVGLIWANAFEYF